MADAEAAHQLQYVKLVSAEGCEFLLPRSAACISKMMKEMIEAGEEGGPFGAVDNIPFPEIGTTVLDLVCQYLSERNNHGSNMTDFKPLKSLDPKKEDDRQTVIELLLAANYLDC
eukprot:TRINITY_DN10792_c0_g1_i1.p4 TRINITY_DN10792_c0_g1~~TRINITY_DN10792_c0_g1_i1.p4  ORF type:complete len:115 (-),score=22.33 TRINITY_DN10792_c0_g1_i1:455-799(-)